MRLTLNRRETDLAPATLERLSDTLRAQGLTGVRVSCSEGECGSCTVLVDGRPVTSCLMLAAQAEGTSVETIECDDPATAALQQACIEEQGFQCGFCTAGFILTARAFLARTPDPSEDEVREALSGSICRCGAYPFITRAVLKAAASLRGAT